MKKVWALVALSLGCYSMPLAAVYKHAGGRSPGKIGGTPGQQGAFVTSFENPTDWGNVVYNIQNRFPGSKPTIIWAVGPLKEKVATLTDEQRRHEEHLTYFDQTGISVYLEIWPSAGQNVEKDIDTWLGKFKSHKSVVGFGVDMEWYGKVDDVKAETWDKKVKSHNPSYRLHLKDYRQGNMPAAYAKKSDVICIGMSSEESQSSLTNTFTSWANGLSPAAVGFQAGYPWDESWWKNLADPPKDFGEMVLKGITNANQELSFFWVTTRSPLTKNWDLTKGAPIGVIHPIVSQQARNLKVERTSQGLSIRLLNGYPQVVPIVTDITGRSRSGGFVSGRYFARLGDVQPSFGITILD